MPCSARVPPLRACGGHINFLDAPHEPRIHLITGHNSGNAGAFFPRLWDPNV